MQVNIKRLHPDAVIPTYACLGDAGLDLTAVSRHFDEQGTVVYGTGLAFEIPEGYVGLVFPRSSICRLDLSLSNAVGVIDSGYRGEVTAKFRPALMYDNNQLPTLINPRIYDVGERIAQIIIIPYPRIEFNEVETLSETERGVGGYGHTGN